VAATVRIVEGSVAEARVGYLSVNEVPTVVDLTAALAPGMDDSSLAEAGELALGSLDPAADIHATADYRAHLVRVLTARVLRSAHDDAVRRAS
jgi:carbon-monoxide dehydrogenase medium subunit